MGFNSGFKGLREVLTGCTEISSRLHTLSIFNVYGSVYRKYIPIYIQQDATLHGLFISGNRSTCFGWYPHPSSEAHTTVSTASGICHTVTATCRYRGRDGTGLSMLWLAYVSHSTLKPVPVAAGSSNGVTNTRCCRYSCIRS